jgi:hypothetical protein
MVVAVQLSLTPLYTYKWLRWRWLCILTTNKKKISKKKSIASINVTITSGTEGRWPPGV